MTERASQSLVPFALGAMAVWTFLLVGCKPEEPAAKRVERRADPPSVYMKDPAFRQRLGEKRAARNELMGAREKLIVEAERRVEAMRAKLSGAADDATVRRELEKDPEWNSLMKRIKDATAAVNDNRMATGSIIRERLAPRPQEPQQ